MGLGSLLLTARAFGVALVFQSAFLLILAGAGLSPAFASEDEEWTLAPELDGDYYLPGNEEPRRAPRYREAVSPSHAGSDTAPAHSSQNSASRPPRSERPAYSRPKISDPKKRTKPFVPPGSTMSYAPISRGLVLWRCERKSDVLQMSSREGSCGFVNARGDHRDEFHPAFARHLDRHLFRCISNAAVRAGLPRPARAEIGNMSGHRPGDRRYGEFSYHGKARALDLGSVRLLDENGNPIPTGIRPLRYFSQLRMKSGEIVLHREYFKTDKTTRKFYLALRACWASSLRSGCDPTGAQGSIGCEGSGGVDNAAHNDHIHLQFPERCGR